MTQVTYREVQDTILENTEIGYTLKSQDKLWTCFTFDVWSEESDPLRYNRLFFRKGGAGLSYEHDGDVLYWTSRWEAEAFRKTFQAEHPDVEVHVINWGDDSRAENAYLDERVMLMEGKYAGSEEALVAMAAMRTKWLRANGARSPLPTTHEEES